jgi:predicted esterase
MASLDADDGIGAMSMKDLKALIKSAGLGFADCVEKSEMRTRAREAQARLAASSVSSSSTTTPSTTSSSSSSSSFSSSSSTSSTSKNLALSGYACIVSGPEACLSGSEQPDLVILILHGLGATNTNFTDLPQVASSLCSEKKVAWIFPQADGHGWWELDVMKWMMAMQQGEAGLASLLREEPPGLQACRVRMKTLLAEARALLGGVALSRFVLGGFSQGAMTAMDLALQLDGEEGGGATTKPAVAGVTMLSGAPIVVDQWAERLPNHKGLKVFMSHGRADQVLPFVASGWCRDLLQQGGASVTYEPHGGGHELGPSTFASLVAFWSSL